MIRRWLGVGMALLSLSVIVYAQTQNPQSDGWLVDVMALLAIASPSVIGAYLVWRLPENPVGWILVGFGLTFTLGVIGEGVAVAGGPFAAWGAWFGSWQWAASMTLVLVFLPLLFPTGRLPSPRYRWVPPVAWTGLALVVFGNALKPVMTFSTATTEIAVPLPMSVPQLTPLFDPAAAVGIALLLIAVAAALVGAVGRFRRSHGIERQQMKVFAGALGISVTGMALNLLLYELGNTVIANLVFTVFVLVLVGSIAIAVLRYRLYDFDRVIRRTLTYGIVSLVLAGVYVACVLGLQALLGSNDPLAVAASTLAAAALFNPVRRRVQAFVERRFDRARYDASQVIEGFGSRLREEVELDELALDLSSVVHQTLRPAAVSVWLAKDTQ